jgi:hypothetical protein
MEGMRYEVDQRDFEGSGCHGGNRGSGREGKYVLKRSIYLIVSQAGRLKPGFHFILAL